MKLFYFTALLSLFTSVSVIAQKNETNKVIPITTSKTLKIEILNASELRQSDFLVKLIDAKNKSTLLNRRVHSNNITRDGNNKIMLSLENLSPKLWAPNDPNLYLLELTARSGKETRTFHEQIGFRDFKAENGKFYLNGKPIFLKGNAINPPGRGIPDSVNSSRKFAEEYISYLKSININIIRFPGATPDFWYDVCDELGMMVFGGNYSGSTNGGTPPTDTDYDKALKWYKEDKFASIAHHPSLMIYTINNETAFTGEKGAKWLKFQTYIYENLKKWDASRAYIANAGYGYGKTGNVCDLHRYWGWYYNTPFTFLNIRDQEKIIPFDKPDDQPITFTECVGNYIGPDGRYNLTSDNKAPQSQLNWTGHASSELQVFLANQHQAFTYKMATELFRRMRYLNQDLSGVVPFTILFNNWNTITRFSDMNPKPVTAQTKKSFQPILLSWENWTPHLYAGATFHPILHIVNDDTNFSDLHNASVVFSLTDHANNELYSESLKLPSIKYYDTYRQKLNITIPATAMTGWYKLVGKIIQDDKVVSSNEDAVYISTKNSLKTTPSTKSILLYDTKKSSRGAFDKLGIPYKTIKTFNNLTATDVLVIGELSADNQLLNVSSQIKKFISAGGRILFLRQNAEIWKTINAINPVELIALHDDIDKATYPKPQGATANGINLNIERTEHPVFTGIDDRRLLRYWNDYKNWNETKEGFPAIYPVTNGFILKNKEDIGTVAALANYGPGLNGMALAEFFEGKGSVIISGFDLVNRAGADPVADLLLKNLAEYTASRNAHQKHPLIESPIIWGDYETEKGVLTGEVSGLLLNSTPRLLDNDKTKYPVVITEEGHQFAKGNIIGWADHPGQQYVPYGRRPFGPYYLRGMGSIAEIEKNADKKQGIGFFYCSVNDGKTTMTTKVWNPHTKDLEIKVKVNDLKEVVKTIPANSTADIDAPIDSDELKITYTGDRRLVLLQTSFE